MKLLKRMLVSIDFSNSSENVLKNSIKFARTFKSEITLIHILPDYIDDEKVSLLVKSAASAKLNELSDKIKEEGVDIGKPILEYGNYCDKIVNASDKINANLVVVGAGEKLKKDAFQLGTTAEKIIRKSNKPVLVVKNDQTSDIQNIICPVDFSEESSRALNSAITLSRMFNAKLLILSVYTYFHHTFTKLDPVKINEQRKLEHEKKLNKFLKEFNLVDINVVRKIAGGEPAEEILKTIKKNDSDLLIMGTTGKSGISKILMGSVTEKVTREVLCSFITLKNKDIIKLEIESKIQDIENHYAIAQELYEKGFFEESINQFTICLGINFAHVPSLKGIAKVYEKLDDIDSAKRYREMVKDILDQMWNLKIEQEARKQTKQ
ncbi:universal stress protein [Arenibacter sp. TNZ]|uniref:universal stress protein n=1 Tax=Arenibacter TaxID=178469 RepID=UPI000CD3E8F0|nr:MULTISPECIES: universal stress protein [Arenibacter]MCM4171981.1 universal stress protein [Arenibacter sp. TNZ]